MRFFKTTVAEKYRCGVKRSIFKWTDWQLVIYSEFTFNDFKSVLIVTLKNENAIFKNNNHAVKH